MEQYYHIEPSLWSNSLSFVVAAALELAFSSLYRDEVHLSEGDITGTVAAASMLQMVRERGSEGGRGEGRRESVRR